MTLVLGWAIAAAAVAGAAAVPVLAGWGRRRIGVDIGGRRRVWLAVGVGAGVVAGFCGGVAAVRAGSGWWLAGLWVWAVFLTSAAVCDAATQRIPTALVWCGASATAALLLAAAAVSGDWRGLVVSVIAAVAAGLIVLGCWRFAGAGFGDVRLAVLGGCGLGHTRYGAVVLGVVVFAVLIAGQAVLAYARTRDRRTMIAYGPALAAGFLIAASA